MKKYGLCIITLFFFTVGWSQSGENLVKQDSPNNLNNTLTVQNTFEALTIQAYSVQANTKVDELFEYVQLLVKSENSSVLEAQLTQNIQQLFISEQPILLVGLESKENFYSVQQWLEDWKSSGSNIEKLELMQSELIDKGWINKYRLTYVAGEKMKTKTISIHILLQPSYKTFGKTKKKVWDMKLGNLEIK